MHVYHLIHRLYFGKYLHVHAEHVAYVYARTCAMHLKAKKSAHMFWHVCFART